MLAYKEANPRFIIIFMSRFKFSADFVIYEPLTLWRCQAQLSNRYMYLYIFPPNCAITLTQVLDVKLFDE